MNEVNIVVMGKTGAGKSTIVNAILGEQRAEEGDGQAITKENQIYETVKQIDGNSLRFKLYDTVGLEIDEKITNRTIEKIEKHIDEVEKSKDYEDISVVWFCINSSSRRLETYEINLMRKISVEKGIPFVVVITQCYDPEKGELEKQLEKELPNNNVMRILAKDSKSRIGIFPAFGLEELIELSIKEYKNLRVKILEETLQAINKIENDRRIDIEEKASLAYEKVHIYEKQASKIGILPGLCIPIIHGKVIKMINEINTIFRINGMTEDYIADFILGLIATPFMLAPGMSVLAASVYVGAVGESYTEALVKVVKSSNEQDLKNNDLMKKRIKSELSKVKEISK